MLIQITLKSIVLSSFWSVSFSHISNKIEIWLSLIWKTLSPPFFVSMIKFTLFILFITVILVRCFWNLIFTPPRHRFLFQLQFFLLSSSICACLSVWEKKIRRQYASILMFSLTNCLLHWLGSFWYWWSLPTSQGVDDAGHFY